MSASKIRKGDLVRVITGKDKDKEGKVLSVNAKNHTVLVEGINMVSKHTKPNAQNQTGGIVSQESSIDISNVMLVVDGKATRVGYEVEKDGKVRVCKKCGAKIK